MRYARLLTFAAVLGVFLCRFQPGYKQWAIDGLWVLAIVLWMFEVRSLRRGPRLGLRPSWIDVEPIAVFLFVFAAAWLPFYDNWRWAYTGDSVSWYTIGDGAARYGLSQNILSLGGVDGNFTYLHSLAFNGLMFVFEPTLWWHRVGKLIVSSLSLVAIYAYFTLTVSRWWALAVAIATATNYVWLWFSYVSYGHIDSHIFYFNTLILAALIWRRPDLRGLWMLCGLVGGLSLFFTQTSWSAVLVVGLFLSAFALVTGRVGELMIYAVSFLLVATPVLLQFSTLLDMTTRQARSIFEWNYLVGIFTAIMRLPYASSYAHIGVSGGFFRWPLSQSYVYGGVLAALALVPVFRRALCVPTVAPIVLGLLLWDAVLMTLTNNAYGYPSSKRAYSLIPLQASLALLPFCVVYAWCRRWRRLRNFVAAVTVAALAVYSAYSFEVIVYPKPGLYGTNAFDGFIELRQRFPKRTVSFLTSRADYGRALAGEGFFHESYHLMDQLTLESEFTPATVERVCGRRAILCVEPHFDLVRLKPLLDRYRAKLRPFPLLNSKELICYDCSSASTGNQMRPRQPLR